MTAPINEKRLRDSTQHGSLNRLSQLQRKLILMAYRNYADHPMIAPAGTPSQYGKVPSDQSPSVGICHLYTSIAIADYLGVNSRRDNDYCCRRAMSGNQFRCKADSWKRWLPLVDPKDYNTAQAAISRAFRRLQARGLVEATRLRVTAVGGIQLTAAGIALGERLAGIEPAPRAWRAGI